MKLVIKVGTQSILAADGTPFEPVMEHLVEQIALFKKDGHQVVLVSSGAVGSGRKIAEQLLGRTYGNAIGEKQVLASLGQPELMHRYALMCKKHGLLAAQLLLTKQDFHTRQHYLNIARLLHEVFNHKIIIPIINENDSVAIEELMFTDNDELAGLIAAQVNADKLIILSNISGVYTAHPAKAGAELISCIHPDDQWPEVSALKSQHGRGGMLSKLAIARKMSSLGITTHILSMDMPSVLTRILNDEPIGTKILPRKKKSPLKRWIAFSEKQAGSITVNPCLFAILKENLRIISLLPVGIQSCHGNFKRGDLIEILGPNQERLGVGIARYGAEKLQELLGQKGKPVFIHYDHLHIF
ncbi:MULTISPECIES: glutamate 5-kinase [Legionella]|uniref:Glutamate 5-kinase n=1 Tax=Legionella septentrionalis TaxID=2498109 RepID=A0A433JGQ9_9GAMM|nr:MULTISPECIES: glutamate 5-kinase [Legionella]MCP0914645.1 glutamate 5-kinase [Legionella sp. 27cVA30]RUQ81011.1 glutamate 5-kinase [Legionella septentrionalis]RUR08758.1 glutamate 5-kinase [Legionella septentrionalis]RUR13322.1 glutamate 5-kinase [Legionella septentrionalis]